MSIMSYWKKLSLLTVLLFGLAGSRAVAATINASSCSLAAVQSAVSQAQAGDTVNVPAGTCSWSGGLSISGIQLIGAGKSTSGTVITSGAVTMTKHATQYTRVSGFRFTGSDRHVTAVGSASNKPYVIDNNYLFTSGGAGGSTLVGITVNGGLLHHNDFTASSGTGADVFNIATSEDWAQAATFGNADTTGERNIYLEDNIFTNILETAPDGDMGGRYVIRYNTYRDSSIVFHGGYPTDSSPQGGTRQFEVYNNTFDRVSNSFPVNKWVWVRGSSGVIANNNMEKADSPDGSSYPDKSEIQLTVGCPTAYPVQYQIGQSTQTPQNPPSRPLLIFGNTGAGSTDSNFITVAGSQTAGPPCSTPNNYIQMGRDYMLSNTWGWTPYTYPHPLQALQGGGGPPPPPTDTQAPSTPSGLTATPVSSSQINLGWTASTDNVAVTGYRLERCQGSGCTSFTQIATPVGASYSDTSLAASTVYTYRVRATDAAGNLSAYSGAASATTMTGSSQPPPLPQGNTGISSQFSGDVNIQSHADVLFTDDFESYTSASQLTSKWSNFYQGSYTRIASETGNFFLGGKALEFTLPQTSSEVANAVVKNLSSTQDTLFVRVYTKFDALYDVNNESNHNGIRISAQYPGPGMVPNGNDFFMAMVENAVFYNEADPGYAHVYIYHPEQRSQWGDIWYPDGKVLPFDLTAGNFGPYFVPRANFIPQRDRWYSYEFMVKANTAGQRDGRVAYWIDGVLMADFQNVRVRDISTLKIDQIQLELHSQSSSRVNKKWYDNLVVAKSYIGPMNSTPPPPQDTQSPTTPASMSAATVSTSQINVSWSAATDNVGVTGYQLERCTGGGCSNFALLSTVTTTSYSNTGLAASTSYSYRVRATDAAGNLSGYSSVVTATTQSAPPPPSPCVTTPLSVSVSNWPSTAAGNRQFRYSSSQIIGNFAVDMNLTRATFTDSRGCTAVVNKP